MRVLAEGKIEQLFSILDSSSELIQKAEDQSYLDSLIDTLSFMQSDDNDFEGLTSADAKS